MQIGKSSYYGWKNKGMSFDNNGFLLKEIQGVALEFPFYGYRRVTKELQRRKILVNHKRVLRLMRENNILCRQKKKFKPVTTQSDHSCRIYPNLAKNLIVTGLNQLWIADITYIRLPHGFAYLAAILDMFSRRCIGWALEKNIDTQLTTEALIMAINLLLIGELSSEMICISHLIGGIDLLLLPTGQEGTYFIMKRPSLSV